MDASPVGRDPVTFDEAMAKIRRNGRVTVRLGEMTVAWRFGREVVLGAPGRGKVQRFVDYTPTRDDMLATDWVEVAG